MARLYDQIGQFFTDTFGLKDPTDSSRVANFGANAEQVTATTKTHTFPNLTGTLLNDAVMGMTKGRYGLQENFNRAPQLNAAIAISTNIDFEVLGTNAVSADVTQYAEGGIAVSTHGAQNDSTIILPHLDTAQSAWTSTTWGTDQQVEWECNLQTPAAVTSCVIWAGLKKTNTPTLTTDTDQAYIVLDTSVGTSPTYWHAVYSINNTDTDTALTSLAAVAAATNYKLAIRIDSSRIARFYINDTLAATSTALKDTTDLIPYVGIKDLSAGSARTLYLFNEKISRKTGA